MSKIIWVVIIVGLIILLILCSVWEILVKSVGAVSTIVIAIFTLVLGVVAYRQHRMYNDPELRVTSPKISKWEYRPGKGGIWDLEMVLINPGAVPIEIYSIWEYEQGRAKINEHFPALFKEPPKDRPVGVYVTQLPWIIEKGYFAISQRRVYTLDIENPIEVEIQYFVNKPKRVIVTSVPLKGCKILIPQSEKEIIDILKQLKEELFRKFLLFKDTQAEIYRDRLYRCIINTVEKLLHITDDLQSRIREGYYSPLCKVVGFLQQIIKSYNEGKWEVFNIKMEQTIGTLDDIIKRWDVDISLPI